MRTIKKSIYYVIGLVYGAFAAYWFPTMLLIAFNYTKGIANNPDGDFARPIGIVLGLLLLVGLFIFGRSVIKTRLLRKTEKWICFSVFALSIIIGTVPVLYVWEEFFYCLTWYLNH